MQNFGFLLAIAWALAMASASSSAQVSNQLCFTTTAAPRNCVPVDSTNPLPVTASSGSGATTVVGVTSNAAGGVAPGSTNVANVSYNYWWNGTGWDQAPGDATNGTRGYSVPTSLAAAGIAPVATSVAASSNVIKASAGNLYGIELTAGASAGYLLIFDATSAPADGTVSPKYCKAVAANQSIELSWASNSPATFATGITAVFSTTGCFSKTASATAFISGLAK